MSTTKADILLWIATWPYYWTMKHFTITPIRRMVRARHDNKKFREETLLFIHGKIKELTLVTLGSTLSAAANIGAFSWDSIQSSPWVVFAMWYFSLVLAILSLITAGQQSALIHTLVGREEDLFTNLHTKAILKLVAVNSTYASATKDSEPDDSSDSSKTLSVGDEQETQPSVIMMYMWQNPVMLMAWSVVIFLLGLTLHVTSPLRHDLSGINNRKTGIFFLTSGAIASLNFLWCNFWIYRVAQHGEDLENLTESGLMENKNVASTSVL